jgi:hypothetical protein
VTTSAILNATHVYIGTKSCGCRVAVVVDERTRDTAKDVADFIRKGLIVTRESLADYRKTVPWPRCNACKTQREAAAKKTAGGPK